jgi:retron-type reverse transcriptase
MRLIQYRILTRILDLALVPDYIHGFEKGKSIPSMAQVHVEKDVVISLDIKDFFPSIKQYMVQAMYQQLGIDEKSSLILSELCTYKAYVPQGSLTAPKISNLIAGGTFGPELKKLCDEQGLTLSIYADDVTVSYNEKLENDKEARRSFAINLVSEISRIIEKYGFRINIEKTKIMRQNTRQWVCGAVVNAKVNMRRTERNLLRALVYNCAKSGVEAQAAKVGMGTDAFIRKYAGRINWLCQLNMDAGARLKTSFRRSSAMYLKNHPDIEIPELAWNSGIEFPYVSEPEDELIFSNVPELESKNKTESPF